jgi:hypothetical protein
MSLRRLYPTYFVKPSTGRIVQASRPAGASVHGALAGDVRRGGPNRACVGCPYLRRSLGGPRQHGDWR